MEGLEVCPVSVKELAVLKEISETTFSEKFSKDNIPENLEYYLKSAFSVDKLYSELTDEKTEFYFGKKGNEIVGYIKLNKETSQNELKTQNSIELERIYVRKPFQNQKVGQFLLDFAIQRGKELKAEFIWLGVWEKNSQAIRFYSRNGFEHFDSHSFWLGNDEQRDLMMKRILI